MHVGRFRQPMFALACLGLFGMSTAMAQTTAPEIAVSVPPGATSAQIRQIVQATPNLTDEIKETPAEGSLIDGTFRVKAGTSRNTVLHDIAEAAQRALHTSWQNRTADLPLAGPAQMLTLASIVQKEGWPRDYRQLAGLYVNRLRRHMRLQADSTIVYGLVGGQGSLGHAISRAELDKPTPYNTYQIDGLPPGPIVNPSAASLEAIAHPMMTNALYVTPDGTGGLAFAETAEDAKRNIARWRERLTVPPRR